MRIELVCVVVAMLLSGIAEGAAKVDVVEAVLPDWPQGEPTEPKGTVVVEFVLVPGGQVFVVDVKGDGLPAAFENESRRAMREWLIKDDDTSNCGLIHGQQEFRFVGAGEDPVELGETKAWISGDATPLFSLDRVEMTGGRILRSKAKDPKALALHSEKQDSYQDRRYARWKAASGGTRDAPYVPPGITLPVPKVRIEPLFPRNAMERGQSGEVVARLLIDTRGRVAKVEVVDSHPKGTFEQASRKALMHWKFAPAIDDRGQPVMIEVCQVLSYLVIDEGTFRQGPR